MSDSVHSRAVGLVSLPWMALSLPSIQLATLASALASEGIDSESHELYVDYAARIGLHLYNLLSNAGGFIEEWLFARDYFWNESRISLDELREMRIPFGLKTPEEERAVLDALASETSSFLDEVAAREAWHRYDILGFTLTISQTAATMALASRLKRLYPGLTIVCGGASCAGPMGPALLRICPYLDAAVLVEGEPVFPELVRRVRAGAGLEGLPGVAWRTSDGTVVTNPGTPLFAARSELPHLRYDSYLERLESTGLSDRIRPWLPFESSRGCWWAEVKQCTFCGLHEIMKFRDRSWESVLAELESWEERYGIINFFAVDLILDRSFFKTLLPALAERNRGWTLFYELKANLKRAEMELLANAGVRWIQPGLESLNGETLQLMQKGVTPLQNIQVLKWCQEYGIQVTWNVIYGIPGETPNSYRITAERMAKLAHLPAPTGASPFQLHRFSPYFDHPAEFGIVRRGAHPLYRFIFPVEPRDLDDLVYLHHCEIAGSAVTAEDLASLLAAVDQWRSARARNASLSFSFLADGAAEIRDSRALPERTYLLTPSEALLYRFLDEIRYGLNVAPGFLRVHPEAGTSLGGEAGIRRLLSRWQRKDLVLRDGKDLVAIAVDQARVERSRERYHRRSLPSPVPYLGEGIPHL